MSESQRKGRTFFVCALVLIAVMLFEPIITSFAVGNEEVGGNVFSSVLYGLVLVAAFRGGGLSLGLIKGCFSIFLAILVVAFLLILIASIRGTLPPQKVDWTTGFFATVKSLAPLVYIYWALFVSKSVREFVRYQKDRFHSKSWSRVRTPVGEKANGEKA